MRGWTGSGVGFAVLAGWVVLMAAFDRTDVKELAIGIGTKASAVTSA